MNTVRLFNVAPIMPQELQFLETLSYNMWWCWNSDAIELFRRIDPPLWKETGHNPFKFLGSIPQKRLEKLTDDDGFMSHYQQVMDRFRTEVLDGKKGPGIVDIPDSIAYFSLEYGLHESIRLYSGGLGCLSGDHLKASSDAGLPLVAVGLLYGRGYCQQFLGIDGWQQEVYPTNDLHHLPVKRALDVQGQPVSISLPLPNGEELHAIVWRMDVGRIPLFLLDTNVHDNSPELRRITSRLYEDDRLVRLRQELLLGIGGFKALTALGYDPPVCHMNEGHAAFVGMARISHLMKTKGLTLEAALEVVPRANVFTTHTPVPAGNETFPLDMVRPYLDALQKELGIDPAIAIEWGISPMARHPEQTMTILALRMAHWSNGVSRLHGVVARKMWAPLWPGRPVDEIPIRHITNGIHIASWLSLDNAVLFDRYLGPEWRDNPMDEDMLARVFDIPDEELWRAHEVGRSRLVRAARELGEKQLRARHATVTETAQMKSVLHHGTLTIGFARRFATYKRATLLLRDPQRLEAILNNRDRPVQFVFAGKAHPADREGKELIRQVIEFAKRPSARQKIVFLEDYDVLIARYLVQGVDIWLNTPRRPQEASGTSGMKAALNGALNASILDGWWDEGYSPECGWAIGRGEDYDNQEHQDNVDALALYNMLESEIVPRYYDRPEGDTPTPWVNMMKASMKKALGYFSSHRMIREYQDLLYKPAREEYRKLTANGCKEATSLETTHRRLDALWGKVTVELPRTDKDIAQLHVGDKFMVFATVNLGELKADEVNVQVYYGPVDSDNRILTSNARYMELAEEKCKGTCVFKQELRCETTGRFGLTVRVVPAEKEWSSVIPGYMTWAGEPEPREG